MPPAHSRGPDPDTLRRYRKRGHGLPGTPEHGVQLFPGDDRGAGSGYRKDEEHHRDDGEGRRADPEPARRRAETGTEFRRLPILDLAPRRQHHPERPEPPGNRPPRQSGHLGRRAEQRHQSRCRHFR